ncbi:MAG: hypothetical protein ACI9FJ_001239, partial [Alteromonadaceae bacterium]
AKTISNRLSLRTSPILGQAPRFMIEFIGFSEYN